MTQIRPNTSPLHVQKKIIRSAIRRASATLLLGVFSCTSIVDPALDLRAQKFTPPAVYARWWAMTESCSGLNGSLSDVTWYSVPGESVGVDGEEVGGYWSPASKRIVIAGDGMLVGTFVRHEMLHALLRNSPGHSREYFLDLCGGVVSCGMGCIADAGPPRDVDPATPRISATALVLGVSVVPQSPGSEVDGGVFTVIVTATNPNPYPVVVTPDPQDFNQTFRCAFFRATGTLAQSASEFALDPSIRNFRAGETKRQYFDFPISRTASARTVPSGTYRLLGGYDVAWTAIDNVKIGP